MTTPLCPACAAESLRWLDYRLPPAPIQLIDIGGGSRNAADRRTARARQWRDTITTQQRLIREFCTRNRHARPPTPLESPRV